MVIYTRRPRLLEYTSCLNGKVTPLRYPDAWHDESQLYIPPSMRTAEDVRAQVCRRGSESRFIGWGVHVCTRSAAPNRRVSNRLSIKELEVYV